MEKNKTYKIIIGALLAAMSAAIRLFFDYLVPSGGTFGVPLYSIPLIISSLYLGPWYSLLVGFVADLGIGFLGPYGYKPLFVISSLSWAFFPGIIAKKNYNFGKMAISIFIAYIVASLGNTFAMFIHYGREMAVASLFIRIALAITLSPVIFSISHVIYDRILQFQSDRIIETKNKYTKEI